MSVILNDKFTKVLWKNACRQNLQLQMDVDSAHQMQPLYIVPSYSYHRDAATL